jgi:hypothetical protein
MFDNIVERGQLSSNTALFFNANSKKKTKLKYLLYSVTNLVVDLDPDPQGSGTFARSGI